MFFILSKVLSFLLFPLVYVFVLLLVAIFSKDTKRKRKFLIYAVVVLYIFSNSFLINRFAQAWDIAPAKLEKGKVYNTVIVLGGFSSDDKDGKGMFNNAADRFIQAVLLQKTGRVKNVLITSGNGNLMPSAFREGTWAGYQLKAAQIPDSCILIEDKSRNTLENASFTKALLQKKGQQGPYLLVTSAFHMRRSIRIFKKVGLDIIPYPCNYIAGTNGIGLDELIPSADALSKWSTYIKEVIGLTVNYVSNKG
ncbi:YdcF family protein [Mucilaginibacter aquaedulcis]|uniref:YdcF family protein n=1 Tax=Mucilaginibacter aquaedulcis TaxID=1187081 RepID=UPI0025B3D854|nr:YdcF family protein [Mucilaginibacter aquaedulcis]MDN3549105.1 YdcF family protein [Mucilaginibacter aquaedulcis]